MGGKKVFGRTREGVLEEEGEEEESMKEAGSGDAFGGEELIKTLLKV